MEGERVKSERGDKQRIGQESKVREMEREEREIIYEIA